MYFNVGGGVVKAGLSMHDTMAMMPYPIMTVNMGMAAQVLTSAHWGSRTALPRSLLHVRIMCHQVASFLVASGTKGKRYALPNSRFMLQNPRIEQPVDREGNARTRVMQARARVHRGLCAHLRQRTGCAHVAADGSRSRP